MELSDDYDLQLINDKELNVYRDVHLFFYTYIDGELNVLMSRKLGGQYHEFYTEILPSDELPTYAISRLMSTTYRGLFKKSNLEKIKNGEEITLQDIERTDEYHWHSIWSNEVFYEWLDMISNNPIQYDSFRGKMIYFLDFPNVNLEFLNKNLVNLSLEFELCYYNYSNSKDSKNNLKFSSLNINLSTLILMEKFNFDEHILKTKKMFEEDSVDYYIILACKKPGNKKDQAGFFHFPALIPGIYRKNHEKWIYLVASTDEFPNENLLNKTRAIIVPGSELNIYNDLEFLRKTEDYIKNVIINFPHLKFLGLCFGMQILVTAFGGKVEKIGENMWIHGSEKLEIEEEFWNFNFVKKSRLEKKKHLVIRQAHGDHVTQMPVHENFKISNFAFSESCAKEILVSEDERVFCIQGHPEYETEFALSRATEFACIRSNMQPTTENKIMMKKMMLQKEKYPKLDNYELRTLCHSFLKN